MPSIETYRAALTTLPAADWEPYLLPYSNLPGPRGNLEPAIPNVTGIEALAGAVCGFAGQDTG